MVSFLWDDLKHRNLLPFQVLLLQWKPHLLVGLIHLTSQFTPLISHGAPTSACTTCFPVLQYISHASITLSTLYKLQLARHHHEICLREASKLRCLKLAYLYRPLIGSFTWIFSFWSLFIDGEVKELNLNRLLLQCPSPCNEPGIHHCHSLRGLAVLKQHLF